MFRELIRKHLEMPMEECIELLKNERRSVLSVIGDDGYPYGTPMNHFYNEDDGCIYFHCGKVGHRLDALRACPKASLSVTDAGTAEEGNWALRVKSVIVFGRVEIIDDQALIADIVRRLCYKFTSDEEYINGEFLRSAKATLLLKLVPEHICGKRVQES